MSKIDIVIPVYNQANLLLRCLDSIKKQTLDNYSVIIVNDGSTDKLENVLTQLKQNSFWKNKVKIINQKNKGAAAARNNGFKKVTAPYVLFCDADISLQKTCLAKMLNVLKRYEDCSYAYSSFKYGPKVFKLFPFNSLKLRQAPYIHTTSLIRSSDFPGFDESLKRFQDWDLWLTMLQQKHCGKFIDEILFQVKPGGTMSKWLPKKFYQFSFLPQVEDYNKAKQIVMRKHNL